MLKKLLLIFCLLAAATFSFAQKNDSLLNVLKSTESDSLKAVILYQIGVNYANNDSAIIYLNRALSIEISLKNKLNIAHIQYAIGLKKYNLNQLDSAIVYWQKAANSFEKSYSTTNKQIVDELLANCYYSIGLGYYYTRVYSKSIISIQSSLKLRLIYGEYKHIIACYNILGIIHLAEDELEKAENFLDNGLKLAIENQDTSSMITMYVNLASIYVEFEKFTKALEYSQQAYVLNGGVLNPQNASTKMNIGHIYMQLNRLDTARLILEEGAKVFSNSEDLRSKIISLNLLGDLYVKTKEWSNLLMVSNKCMKLYEQYPDVQEQKSTALNLSLAYENLGNENKAYQNYKLYTVLKDSLFNTEKSKEIDRLEAAYQFEKTEKEMAVLLEENLLKEIEISEEKRSKTILLVTASFILLLAAIFFLIYKRNQDKKRHNLAFKKLEIEQRMLRSQMNPHFIFNALNSIQSYISTNSTYEAEVFLSKFSLLVRNILENSTTEFIDLDVEIETLTLYLELEKLRFNDKFDYTIDVNLSDAAIEIPPMLIQPFVENAIIHGMKGKPNQGQINIIFSDAKEDMLLCQVIDNGVGRSLTKNKSTNHQSLSTSLTNDRIQFFNTERGGNFEVNIIDLQDKKGIATGTKVELLIPFNY